MLGWLVFLGGKTEKKLVSRARRIRRTGARNLQFQALESRQLLTGAPLGYATFNHRAIDLADGAVPAATSGPTGYSPQQIRTAYGFDKLPYDGSGTTIAIVDAYD